MFRKVLEEQGATGLALRAAGGGALEEMEAKSQMCVWVGVCVCVCVCVRACVWVCVCVFCSPSLALLFIILSSSRVLNRSRVARVIYFKIGAVARCKRQYGLQTRKALSSIPLFLL